MPKQGDGELEARRGVGVERGQFGFKEHEEQPVVLVGSDEPETGEGELSYWSEKWGSEIAKMGDRDTLSFSIRGVSLFVSHEAWQSQVIWGRGVGPHNSGLYIVEDTNSVRPFHYAPPQAKEDIAAVVVRHMTRILAQALQTGAPSPTEETVLLANAARKAVYEQHYRDAAMDAYATEQECDAAQKCEESLFGYSEARSRGLSHGQAMTGRKRYGSFIDAALAFDSGEWKARIAWDKPGALHRGA